MRSLLPLLNRHESPWRGSFRYWQHTYQDKMKTDSPMISSALGSRGFTNHLYSSLPSLGLQPHSSSVNDISIWTSHWHFKFSMSQTELINNPALAPVPWSWIKWPMEPLSSQICKVEAWELPQAPLPPSPPFPPTCLSAFSWFCLSLHLYYLVQPVCYLTSHKSLPGGSPASCLLRPQHRS